MSYNCELKEQPAQPALTVRTRAAVQDLPQLFGNEHRIEFRQRILEFLFQFRAEVFKIIYCPYRFRVCVHHEPVKVRLEICDIFHWHVVEKTVGYGVQSHYLS